MAKIIWSEGLDLEQRLAYYIAEMEYRGVPFDLKKAHRQVSKLEGVMDRLYLKIRPYLKFYVNSLESVYRDPTRMVKVDGWPDQVLEKGSYQYVKKVRLKNGEWTASVLSFEYPDLVAGPFTRIEIVEPSLNKRLKLIEQLLGMGWKPKQFTEKKRPQLTIKGIPVPTLKKLGPFGDALSNWYVCSHRLGQINGFIDKLRDDGRLTPGCNPCGTNTLRAKHHTIANLPRATSFWGKSMRALMTVDDGYKMVGADLAGLELRCLAHRMKDKHYIDLVLNGDVHTYNMEKAGLDNRDQAKTFIYAFLYGAGDGKIGDIIGGTAKDGKEIKASFLAGLPSLSKLIVKVQEFSENNGWLPTLDHRRVFLRTYDGRVAIHTALNLMLQCDGAIIAKRSLVLAEEEILRRQLQAYLMIYYHDEFQYMVKEGIEYEIGELLVSSMELAGRLYKMRLPITGDYKIGNNWRHTH